MTSTAPPIPLRLWAVATITGAGAFMAMLDSTVANLALEAIRADFDASLAKAQWVATGYLIALAVSLPLTGWLSRRFGQSRLWIISTFGFILASALCALSSDLWVLVIARCLQGLAAGLMVPAGQALLSRIADRRQLGRLMGTVGFAVALGPALGPGFGGMLIDTLSWHWLFWINVPLGALALIAGRTMLPMDESPQESQLDGRGIVMMGIGLPLLLYGTAEIGASGLELISLASFALGMSLTAAFLWTARNAAVPLIDMRLLNRPGFTMAVAVSGLTGAAMYGGLLLFPLYFQDVLRQSPTEAGLMLLAMGLGSALALPFAGVLTDERGPAVVCFAGGILLVIGTAPFFAMPLLPSTGFAVLLFLRGIGLALAQMPAMTAAYGAVEKHETGDAATLVNIGQRLGGALGAIATVIVLEHGSPVDDASFQWALLLLFGFALAALFMSRGLPGTGTRPKPLA
ncbi:multidrug efflux MFS transporter [Ochrobactrum sp. CM-21-5]|nr:multidrug efflux MFS transporter [Ochrobactrum sp. CM-21-5]